MASFVDEVMATLGGEQIRACIQCGICTGSCPVAPEMEYPPRKIIAMIRSGMRDEVLSSGSSWQCLSCYMCSCRCPRDVHPTELFHALDNLAVKYNFKVRETRNPAMYRSFTSSIRSYGRVYEFGMMFMYYLRTNPLAALKVLPLGLKLLLHKRMSVLPPRVERKKELSLIIRKFREVSQ
jgi:heterodisulfide reductase subunit C